MLSFGLFLFLFLPERPISRNTSSGHLLLDFSLGSLGKQATERGSFGGGRETRRWTAAGTVWTSGSPSFRADPVLASLTELGVVRVARLAGSAVLVDGRLLEPVVHLADAVINVD